MADVSDEDAYKQDGPVAQKIAEVTPYYKFKGIPRFYDIGGFTQRPDIFQLVVDTFVSRYKDKGITSIGGFDARGFVLGPPIALALKLPFFMLRKPGKMPNSISSSSYKVEYGSRDGMCIPRGHPLDKADPSKKSSVVKAGDKVLLIDDLVATGGTLAAGIELVQMMGAEVFECACVVELKMFIDPPPETGLPSRKKSWTEKGIASVPCVPTFRASNGRLPGVMRERFFLGLSLPITSRLTRSVCIVASHASQGVGTG